MSVIFQNTEDWMNHDFLIQTRDGNLKSCRVIYWPETFQSKIDINKCIVETDKIVINKGLIGVEKDYQTVNLEYLFYNEKL